MTEEEAIAINKIIGMDNVALIHGIMGSRTVSFAKLLRTDRNNKLKKALKSKDCFKKIAKDLGICHMTVYRSHHARKKK